MSILRCLIPLMFLIAMTQIIHTLDVKRELHRCDTAVITKSQCSDCHAARQQADLHLPNTRKIGNWCKRCKSCYYAEPNCTVLIEEYFEPLCCEIATQNSCVSRCWLADADVWRGLPGLCTTECNTCLNCLQECAETTTVEEMNIECGVHRKDITCPTYQPINAPSSSSCPATVVTLFIVVPLMVL